MTDPNEVASGSIRPRRYRGRMTLEPDGDPGDSVEQFVAAFRAAFDVARLQFPQVTDISVSSENGRIIISLALESADEVESHKELDQVADELLDAALGQIGGHRAAGDERDDIIVLESALTPA